MVGNKYARKFFYSNISPQYPSFERGIWKKLEELVRNWAEENESIYLVTGPILRENLATIGPNQISIPEYFYKVILEYQLPEIKAVGFILPNAESKQPLKEFIVSIDSVEHITALDFFWKLLDIEENEIEKKICINCWTWHTNQENKEKGNTNSVATICKGTTKAGNNCRNNTKN
jgi:endonuclease G